ncbi:hypothetical protein [Subtercola boreus]|uniref:hypothetical protein n=1 Tax=Subtercola boreus TaxID=120213 RepID=UPI0026D83C90
MFGLTFEKLIILGVVAAFVIGPERLPHYASVLAKFVRQLRDFTNGAKTRMKEEMGPEFDEVEWKKLDPRQYDPRRIIRDALLEDPVEAAAPVKPSSPMAAGAAAGTAAAGAASASGVGAPGPASAMADAAATDQAVSLEKNAPTENSPVSTAATPDYLSGRKTLDREAAEAPALASPYDSEAT